MIPSHSRSQVPVTALLLDLGCASVCDLEVCLNRIVVEIVQLIIEVHKTASRGCWCVSLLFLDAVLWESQGYSAREVGSVVLISGHVSSTQLRHGTDTI